MQPRRFDGSSDWVAPARVVTVALNLQAGPVSRVRRAAVLCLGLLVGLVLVLSFAAQTA